MTNPWNILKVRTGHELVAHELFEDHGFEVYTPFIGRRQLVKLTRKQQALKARGGRAAKNIKTHVHYADPINDGWLFIRFDGSDAMKYKLFTILERKTYLYGVLTHGETLYGFPEGDMAKYRDRLTELYQSGKHRRLVVRGYDRKKDSRKNRQRKYGQKELVIPVFKAGDKVEFMAGNWDHLMFDVVKYSEHIVDLEVELFGRITRVQAEPIKLRKAS